MPTRFEQLIGDVRVIPVITVPDLDVAVPVAQALVDGGLPALEITLRTPVALDAIERIAAQVPGACVGAGTVTTPAQLRCALDAGARFIVSPGCTEALADTAAIEDAAFLPGAVTATELLRLAELGISLCKFFPAQASGGIPTLRALGAPFPQMRFCPTGGIDGALAPDYLALANVVCVGGSWMVPGDAVLAGDWERIRRLAAEACAMSGSAPSAGPARSAVLS